MTWILHAKDAKGKHANIQMRFTPNQDLFPGGPNINRFAQLITDLVLVVFCNLFPTKVALLPRRDTYCNCIHSHNQGGSSGLDEPDLHLGCNRPLCQSLWTRVRHISLPPYRFLAIIHRRIATPPSHLSLWGTVSHIFCVSYTEILFVKTVLWMFK